MSRAKHEPIILPSLEGMADKNYAVHLLLARFEALYRSGEQIVTLRSPGYLPEGPDRSTARARIHARQEEIGEQINSLGSLPERTLYHIARTLEETYWTDLTPGHLALIDRLITCLSALYVPYDAEQEEVAAG